MSLKEDEHGQAQGSSSAEGRAQRAHGLDKTKPYQAGKGRTAANLQQLAANVKRGGMYSLRDIRVVEMTEPPFGADVRMSTSMFQCRFNKTTHLIIILMNDASTCWRRRRRMAPPR